MSAPVKLLRNVRHPAQPRFTVFDDLQIGILLSLFVRFRDIYVVNNKLLAKTLYDEVVRDLESQASYTAEKRVLHQECVDFSIGDVTELLEHFNSLDESCLRSLEDNYADKIAVGTHRVGFRSIVKPRITDCLFCPSSPLTLEIKKQKCGWKAPGGHSWAYSFNSGAHVAVVCEATCPRCNTLYKLQTYTPGPTILRGTGVITANCILRDCPVRQQQTDLFRPGMAFVVFDLDQVPDFSGFCVL